MWRRLLFQVDLLVTMNWKAFILENTLSLIPNSLLFPVLLHDFHYLDMKIKALDFEGSVFSKAKNVIFESIFYNCILVRFIYSQ